MPILNTCCRWRGMSRIVRFLAVIALALSPVWGVPSVHAASSHTPYWPSFDSSGCNAAGDGQGSVVIACGTGGYVTTQITSAYGGCSQIDLNVSAWGSGPVIAVATAPVGGLQSSVTINSYGDYFMQLSWVPSTIVGPIQLQLSAPDTANYSLSGLTVNPCPVPTSTPTASNTSTPNPSDTVTHTPTVTSTPTPGPSHTLTPIPTNTPLPSGHNTFTPTLTATPANTATVTPTPGPGEVDCGEASFPVLNCNMQPHLYTSQIIPPTYWTVSGCSGWSSTGTPMGRQAGNPGGFYNDGATMLAFTISNSYDACVGAAQNVIAPVAGTVYLHVAGTGSHNMEAVVGSNGLHVMALGTNNLGH